MPLNGNLLGAQLKAAVDGVGDKTDRDALFRAMGNAIVAHILANGVVVGTANGVTAGPAAVPVTGKLT